jgi:hypothetical protein
MGNLQVESGFDPTVYFGGNQNPDPSKVGDNAWGLGQWKRSTSYIIDVQKNAVRAGEPGADGEISKLGTQLILMWWQVKNTSPTGSHHMVDGLKRITDLGQAVHYWQQYFEGSLGQADHDRLVAAEGWKNHVGSGTTAPDPAASAASCSGGASTNATGIVQMALKLSWPDNSHGTIPKPEYQQAYDQFNPSGPGVADCGGFIATVMHASGADKNYPPGGTALQEAYVRAHPEKYDVVDKVNSVGELHPGDILIVNKGSGDGALGHTYIYVGNQPPNNFNEASASLNSRAPNLGKADIADPLGRGDYMRARLK